MENEKRTRSVQQTDYGGTTIWWNRRGKRNMPKLWMKIKDRQTLNEPWKKTGLESRSSRAAWRPHWTR